MTTAIRPTAPTRRVAATGVISRTSHGRTVSIVRTASGTTGSVDLPTRTPGATRPPKPSVPPPVAFAPIVFHTAEAGVLATEVLVADWSPVDFEVYESFASTARPIPGPVLDAAMARLLKVTPYLEADSEFNYVIGHDLDRQDATQVEYDLAAGGLR